MPKIPTEKDITRLRERTTSSIQRISNQFSGEHQDPAMQDTVGTWHVTVYLTSREYGGPEEGGWWYDNYEFVSSEPASSKEEAELRRDQINKELDESGRGESASRNGRRPYELAVIEEELREYETKERPYYSRVAADIDLYAHDDLLDKSCQACGSSLVTHFDKQGNWTACAPKGISKENISNIPQDLAVDRKFLDKRNGLDNTQSELHHRGASKVALNWSDLVTEGARNEAKLWDDARKTIPDFDAVIEAARTKGFSILPDDGYSDGGHPYEPAIYYHLAKQYLAENLTEIAYGDRAMAAATKISFEVVSVPKLMTALMSAGPIHPMFESAKPDHDIGMDISIVWETDTNKFDALDAGVKHYPSLSLELDAVDQQSVFVNFSVRGSHYMGGTHANHDSKQFRLTSSNEALAQDIFAYAQNFLRKNWQESYGFKLASSIGGADLSEMVKAFLEQVSVGNKDNWDIRNDEGYLSAFKLTDAIAEEYNLVGEDVIERVHDLVVQQSRTDWVKVEASRKLSRDDLNKKFTSFMRDLVSLSRETLPTDLDKKFKALRSTYLEYLPLWRQNISKSNKGLLLAIEDVDSWKQPTDLIPYVNRVVALFAPVIQAAINDGSMARVVARYTLKDI